MSGMSRAARAPSGRAGISTTHGICVPQIGASPAVRARITEALPSWRLNAGPWTLSSVLLPARRGGVRGQCGWHLGHPAPSAGVIEVEWQPQVLRAHTLLPLSPTPEASSLFLPRFQEATAGRKTSEGWPAPSREPDARGDRRGRCRALAGVGVSAGQSGRAGLAVEQEHQTSLFLSFFQRGKGSRPWT